MDTTQKRIGWKIWEFKNSWEKCCPYCPWTDKAPENHEGFLSGCRLRMLSTSLFQGAGKSTSAFRAYPKSH